MGKTLGIIGYGKMGGAILDGMAARGHLAVGSVFVTDILQENRLLCAERHRDVVVKEDAASLLAASEVVVIAVKPQSIEGLLREISALTDDKLVVSIAAGVTLDYLESQLSPRARVIRAMPNTPAMVGEGMTALARGKGVSEEEMGYVEALFGAVGKVVIVEEKLMDAVTGLSGSGPAYVFTIIEALADGGVLMGLPRHIALNLAAQTVLGAAKLLIESGKHPGELRDMVTSPAGTTARGLMELERGGLRATLIAAVEAATTRSHELGGKK